VGFQFKLISRETRAATDLTEWERPGFPKRGRGGSLKKLKGDRLLRIGNQAAGQPLGRASAGCPEGRNAGAGGRQLICCEPPAAGFYDDGF